MIEEIKPNLDLTDLIKLGLLKFSENLNKIKVGKVVSVNYEKQTLDAEINSKTMIEKENQEIFYLDYPPLLDVPFHVASGGGSSIQVPIKKNDYCLLFFADHCTENFSKGGDIPNTNRKHDTRC